MPGAVLSPGDGDSDGTGWLGEGPVDAGSTGPGWLTDGLTAAVTGGGAGRRVVAAGAAEYGTVRCGAATWAGAAVTGCGPAGGGALNARTGCGGVLVAEGRGAVTADGRSRYAPPNTAPAPVHSAAMHAMPYRRRNCQVLAAGTRCTRARFRLVPFPGRARDITVTVRAHAAP